MLEDADMEDDPVVEEIEVHLSKSLANNLYLMQYPLRPKEMGYNHLDHLSSRIKPQQKRVEMSLALDTRSKHYSTSKGEQIGLSVDGNLHTMSSDSSFNSPKMDQIILSCPPQSKSFSHVQYAVGLLKDGQLHLTPLECLVQMRPSFDYLDKADKRTKEEASVAFKSGDGGESSQDEAEEEAVPVSMKVAHAESDEYKARRMASYDYVNQKREEERWMNVSYVPADSVLAEAERQHLHADDLSSVSQFKISSQEYLQVLIPPSSESKSEKPAMPDNVLSLNELRKLDLNEQIKALLVNVKVIRFSQLVSFVAPGTDHQAILRALQSMAVLVQGCWVVKSELVYPDEDKEDTTKKRRHQSAESPELLRRVRDYVMWKFTHCRCVVRKDISSIGQLPSDSVKEILEKMSRLKARTGWEFLYEYDRDFCDRHPEIVQRQRNKWTMTFHYLAQHFKLPKDGDKRAIELEAALINQQPTEKHRTRRFSTRSPRKRTLSGRSQSDMSDVEAESASDKNSDRLKGRDSSASRNLFSSQELSVNGHIPSNNMCNGFGGAQGGGTNSDLATELVKFLREMTSERLTITMSDLRSQLAMYSVRFPQGHVFNSGVSDKAIEEAVVAIGGSRLNFQWPNNSKPQALYAFYTGNDNTDLLLRILYPMFEETYRVRTVTFKTAVKTETGKDMSDSEIKSFLKDHCEATSGLWYLKGTLTAKS